MPLPAPNAPWVTASRAFSRIWQKPWKAITNFTSISEVERWTTTLRASPTRLGLPKRFQPLGNVREVAQPSGPCLAFFDAAQGRNSRDTGPRFAIVLGLRSKRVYFALPRARTRSKSTSLLVIFFCSGLALALSFFFRGGSLKPAAPAIFLLVIISVAHFCGRLASLLVAVVGGLIFAAFLFEPYASFAVSDTADRIVLLSFALSAIAV